MIVAKEISVLGLKKGALKEDLPEFYELAKVVENSPWHRDWSVLEHTLAVMEQLEQVMDHAPEKVSKHLSQNVEKHTRRELLMVVGLLHDIGKKETIKEIGEEVRCPGHEEHGALKAQVLLPKFDLTEAEQAIVVELIKHHGHLHKILAPENENKRQQVAELEKAAPHLFLMLLVFCQADTQGSKLQHAHADEYHKRVDFYKKALNGY
jgi:UTP:GlnB (protein PII) uridylyltransferase